MSTKINLNRQLIEVFDSVLKNYEALNQGDLRPLQNSILSWNYSLTIKQTDHLRKLVRQHSLQFNLGNSIERLTALKNLLLKCRFLLEDIHHREVEVALDETEERFWWSIFFTYNQIVYEGDWESLRKGYHGLAEEFTDFQAGLQELATAYAPCIAHLKAYNHDYTDFCHLSSHLI